MEPTRRGRWWWRRDKSRKESKNARALAFIEVDGVLVAQVDHVMWHVRQARFASRDASKVSVLPFTLIIV